MDKDLKAHEFIWYKRNITDTEKEDYLQKMLDTQTKKRELEAAKYDSNKLFGDKIKACESDIYDLHDILKSGKIEEQGDCNIVIEDGFKKYYTEDGELVNEVEATDRDYQMYLGKT